MCQDYWGLCRGNSTPERFYFRAENGRRRKDADNPFWPSVPQPGLIIWVKKVLAFNFKTGSCPQWESDNILQVVTISFLRQFWFCPNFDSQTRSSHHLNCSPKSEPDEELLAELCRLPPLPENQGHQSTATLTLSEHLTGLVIVGSGVRALQVLWEELPNCMSRRLDWEVGRTEGQGQVLSWFGEYLPLLENTLFFF